MLLSSENQVCPGTALVVENTGAMPLRRHRVRRGGSGGVAEQGRASIGRPWNTGEPSPTQDTYPESGCHRATTSSDAAGGDARRRDRRAHRHPGIATARPKTKQCAEASGSLSAPIVPFESWRTRDGEEPVSREGKIPQVAGGHLYAATRAWRHALNPPRQ